ncbi:MAG TPA: phosphopantothenoylcysteine decarboxylase [Candidatus Saccharimonadales bacterium]|nr:phosphopantothenoylcysteine decarboxylase [Candidatus Saccharimonadales bacterium]
MRLLRERGVRFIDPEEGELADGEHGMGRMASLDAIVAAARETLDIGHGEHRTPSTNRRAHMPPAPATGPTSPARPEVPSTGSHSTVSESKLLAGRTIVITAGGTEEPIDPVRIITNRSSGKMGFALAEEARAMGAAVKLITARTSAPPPAGIPRLEALTAEAMAAAVRAAMPGADALVMAAAVSDFTPLTPSRSKMRRREGGMTLDLQSTPDIVASVRQEFPKKLVVGFALETEEEERRGLEKLKKKGLDLIAVNNPLKQGSAFGSDQNEVTLIDRFGEMERLGLRPKREVARAILLRIARALEPAVAR